MTLLDVTAWQIFRHDTVHIRTHRALPAISVLVMVNKLGITQETEIEQHDGDTAVRQFLGPGDTVGQLVMDIYFNGNR